MRRLVRRCLRISVQVVTVILSMPHIRRHHCYRLEPDGEPPVAATFIKMQRNEG